MSIIAMPPRSGGEDDEPPESAPRPAKALAAAAWAKSPAMLPSYNSPHQLRSSAPFSAPVCGLLVGVVSMRRNLAWFCGDTAPREFGETWHVVPEAFFVHQKS